MCQTIGPGGSIVDDSGENGKHASICSDQFNSPLISRILKLMQSYFHAKTDILYVASRKQQRCMHCAYCDLYTVHARLTACFFHVGDVHIM